MDTIPTVETLSKLGVMIVAHEYEPGWVLLRFSNELGDWEVIANFFTTEDESIEYLDYLYSIKAIDASAETLSEISKRYNELTETNPKLH